MTYLFYFQRRLYIHIVLFCALILPLSSSLYADINPENVMGLSCLASYKGTYLELKDSKVFVYARERDTDKDRCAWSYGNATLEEATENALKECVEKVRAKCHVIDKNGEFIVKRAQFSHLEPVDNTEFVDEDRKVIMSQAH